MSLCSSTRRPLGLPHATLALWAVTLLAFGQGCVSTGPLKLGKLGLFGGEKIPVASDKNPVVQVLTMWQPGEGPGIDGKTTRGFVGQIYLFTARSPIAAKARGLVEIYVFDDHGDEEQQTKPLHQFRYEPDSWEMLGQPGKLGQVHTLFVAYTRPGKHKAQCSLRVTFTPDKGLPVHSEMSYVTLPGRAAPGEAATGGLSAARKAEGATGLDDADEATGEDSAGRASKAPVDKARAMQSAQEELARRLQSIDFSAINSPKGRRPATPLDDRERERIVASAQRRDTLYAQAEVADEDWDAPRTRRAPRRTARRDVELAGYEEETTWADEGEDQWEEARPARLSQVDRRRNRRDQGADFADSRVSVEPLGDDEQGAGELAE